MEKKLLLSLVKNGESTYSIAKIVGKSQTTIRYWLKKYNLKTKLTYKISNTKCIRCENNTINGKKYCNSCSITLQRLRYKIALIKYKGGKCKKCGITDIYLLDFHHINSKEKEFSIAKKIKSWKKMKKEADKCELLCANCHRTYHRKKYYYNDLYKDAIKYKGGNKEIKKLLLGH